MGFIRVFSNSVNFLISKDLSSVLSGEIEIISLSCKIKVSLFLIYEKLYLFKTGEFLKLRNYLIFFHLDSFRSILHLQY